MSEILFQKSIPILRIFDVEKAKEFYVGFLGFTIDWEHHFTEGSPVYMQVSRGSLILHLTEHHGDCCPGTRIFIEMTGINQLHQEITSKDYKYLSPGIEETFYNAKCMEVTDPFGNRLTFNEYFSTET
jgi:catechol 2,3-dioxygenase-like lactoylglutathione lyase family enzyme